MSTKSKPIEVFFSYSHRDEELRDELEKHLSILKRQGVIRGWHDRRIGAGREWEGEIDTHLNTAHVILLLISADFLASDYCYDKEMKRAMERHEAREARVIPIILRPVDWKGAPFGKLQALPKDAKPVTSWPDQDEVFLDVARGIRAAVEELTSPPAGPHPVSEKPSLAKMATTEEGPEQVLPEKFLFTFEYVDQLIWLRAFRSLIYTVDRAHFIAEGYWEDVQGRIHHVNHLAAFFQPFAASKAQHGYIHLYNHPATSEAVRVDISGGQLVVTISDRTKAEHRRQLADRILRRIGSLSGVSRQMEGDSAIAFPRSAATIRDLLVKQLSALVSSLVDILAELPPDAPLHERLGNVMVHIMGQISMTSIATGLQFLILLVLSGLWAWILAGGIGRDLQSWELIGIVWLGLTVLPLLAGTFPQSREEEIYIMFKLKKLQRLSLWLGKAFGIYASAFLGEVASVVIWLSLVYAGLWSGLSLAIKAIFWFVMALFTSALSLVGAIIAIRYSWKLSKKGQAPRLRGEDVLLSLGFPFVVYPGLMLFGWIAAPIWNQWQKGCPMIILGFLAFMLMLRREAKR